MERFIDIKCHQTLTAYTDLKSSMERFIVFVSVVASFNFKFKIQYGEIYRCKREQERKCIKQFKIQYGEIYRKNHPNLQGRKIRFKIQYGEIYRPLTPNWSISMFNLKSSMERFIDVRPRLNMNLNTYLKSSMERFIVCRFCRYISCCKDLKSSMERFIANSIPPFIVSI